MIRKWNHGGDRGVIWKERGEGGGEGGVGVGIRRPRDPVAKSASKSTIHQTPDECGDCGHCGGCGGDRGVVMMMVDG